MSRTRVCFFLVSLADGGAQKQAIYLLNEFQQREDLDVFLIYYRPGVHDDLLVRDRLTTFHIPVGNYYDPRNIAKVSAVLRDIKPDVLVTWLPNTDLPGFFLRRASPGLRWVMTERDSAYPKTLRFMVRRLLGRFADAIVANSEKGAQYWANLASAKRISIITNVVHRPVVSSRPTSTITVATIGRLELQKNPEAVIAAFALLAERRPDLRFVVIGMGSLTEALKAQAAASGAGDYIEFLGFRKDVSDQIFRSSVVVSMSHHEGLPNVMLETVASSRLAVVSDIPEHRELFGPDYPYYVGDRGDPGKIADMIEAAVDAREDVSALRYAVQRLDQMSARTIADKYLQVFGSLTRSKG